MCGVVGIVGHRPVNQAIYDALTVLQHRGQDAAGIVTWGEAGLQVRKDNGLVRDVFHHRHMLRLKGNVGIGHVRYPTAGGLQSAEAQPFYVNSPYGICLAHNGNLTNIDELADLLTREDRRHLNTGSDSEVLLNVFAHELQNRTNGEPTPEQIFDAVEAVHRRCRGGYAVVAMIIGHGIVAFRDPNGIRPLVAGVRETEHGNEYIVASESVALDILQFRRLRDVRPGEAIFIENGGAFHSREREGTVRHAPCIFEFVYFARPDSIIDNLSVYKARLRMGEQLAGQIVREWPDHDIDVVIPIPDTSRTSAVQVAYHLGVKYREGFIKNRYIGRTFIMPGQAERAQSVRRKLNAIDLEFRGKNVLLVDDSIVRGTTSRQIIRMARDAGARQVYFASAAPPVRFPNVYGIDMPAASELIANGRSVEEIQALIGADRLIYLDLHGLVRSVRHDNSDIKEFDTSCFSGEYITGDVSPEYLQKLERVRNDDAKSVMERQAESGHAIATPPGEAQSGESAAVSSSADPDRIEKKGRTAWM
jgi:amidophosphoribosyltransferase